MVNYSYTSGAKFRPFSYQEMLQPLAAYTQEYNTIEEALGELGSKADVFNRLANQQTDKKAYSMYKTYADDLTAQAESLAKNGLTPASRQNLITMKRRYSSEITPIEQAYNNRMKQAEEQRKALLQDPTLMFNRLAATTSLDAYLDNPELGYEPYSGKLITSQVASMAQNLAKELRSYGKGKPIDEFTNTFLKRYGLSSAEVLQAINNPDDPRSSKALKAIMDSAIGSTPIESWKDTALLSRAYDYAKQGLWSAIGQDQVSPIENYRARLIASSRGVSMDKNKYRVNPLPLRSPQEISEKNKQIENFIKEGYLMRTDNGLTLTKRGLLQLKMDKFVPLGITSWEQYKKSNPNASRSSYETMLAEAEMKTAKPTLFSSWYNQNIGGYDSMTGKVDTPTTRLNKYENSIQSSSYDVYHTTEYDRQLDSNYGKEFMTQIWSNTGTEDGEKKVQGVEFNGKDGWGKTKTYSKSDLEGYRVTNVRYSKYGNTAILQSDKEGKNDIIRIKIPKGINIGAEINIDNAIGNTEDWNSILQTGKKPIITSEGRIAKDSNNNIIYTDIPLSESDMVVARQKRRNATQDIYGYGSQTVVPSQTTNEQINPWY